MIRTQTFLLVLCAVGGTVFAVEPPLDPQARPLEGPTRPVVAPVGIDFDRPLEADFQEAPLSDVVAYLANQAKCNIVLDARRLDEAGITAATPITIGGKFSLATWLRLLASNGTFDWTLTDNNTLLLTTPAGARARPQLQTYKIGDLLVAPTNASDPIDGQPVLALVARSIASATWDRAVVQDVIACDGYDFGTGIEVPNPGRMQTQGELLIVNHTPGVQRQIVQLLAEMRRAKDPAAPAVVNPLAVALQRKTNVKFDAEPLSDVLTTWRTQFGLPLLVDYPALDQAGIEPETKVTIRLQDTTWQAIFDTTLDSLGLDWTIRDGAIFITTQDNAAALATTRIYQVSDLQAGANPIDLASLIARTILPEDEAAQAQVRELGPLLVVHQPLQIHARIEQLLRGLRADAATAVVPAAEAAPATSDAR